ncbi:hypothetical protein G7046_g285 [Stylonectria norvegica]|nr:hypothetical protein G7046_g285 [Stylonectria norvegica]
MFNMATRHIAQVRSEARVSRSRPRLHSSPSPTSMGCANFCASKLLHPIHFHRSPWPAGVFGRRCLAALQSPESRLPGFPRAASLIRSIDLQSPAPQKSVPVPDQDLNLCLGITVTNTTHTTQQRNATTHHHANSSTFARLPAPPAAGQPASHRRWTKNLSYYRTLQGPVLPALGGHLGESTVTPLHHKYQVEERRFPGRYTTTASSCHQVVVPYAGMCEYFVLATRTAYTAALSDQYNLPTRRSAAVTVLRRVLLPLSHVYEVVGPRPACMPVEVCKTRHLDSSRVWHGPRFTLFVQLQQVGSQAGLGRRELELQRSIASSGALSEILDQAS